MAYFGEAHITAMMNGPMGVDVVQGGTTARGFLDEADSAIVEAVVRQGGIIGRERSLWILTGSLPAPDSGQNVTVSGTVYRITQSMMHGDGALMKLLLADVA
jgi:hypothetical protein